MRSLFRLYKIFWAFAHRNLFVALYLDVYWRSLSSRSCSCERDDRLRARAKRLRSAFEELGPTFVKLGQLLARRDDVFPPPYIEELTGLQEHVRPVPFAEIQRGLGMECICADMAVQGHPRDPKCFHCNEIGTIFEDFEVEPVATASLAQIHTAKLDGRAIAIKFLKPGVLDQINLDLAILWRFRRLLLKVIGLGGSVEPNDFHAELKRSLQMEVDLKAEGLHMSMFRAQNGPDATAPEVYWGFKRDDLLVMEFIEGKPLWESADLPIEDRKALAQRLAHNFLRQVFVSNLFHADPHPGNVFLRAGEIVFLDMGAMGRIDGRTRDRLQVMFQAVADGDVDKATDALLSFGETSEANRSALLTDVGLVIASYGAGTGERWSDRILDTARTHQIRLPRSVILLSKALVLIESLALRLDPEFSLQAVMRSFAPELSELRFREVGAKTKHAALEYIDLLDRLPSLVERALARQAVTP
jgi:ubiquinone biosynthesis protein